MASSYSRLTCSSPCTVYYRQFIASPRTLARSLSTVSSSTDLKQLPFSAIPGPKGTLANMLDYARNGGSPNLPEILRKRFEKFGPIFYEEMFGRRLVNVSDAEAMEKVLRVDSSFQMRPGFGALDEIHKTLDHRTGLLSNNHEKWFQERSLLSPKMMRPKEVSEALPGFNEVARDVVERMRRLRLADETVPDLQKELFYWAIESISSFLFDQRLGFYNHPPSPEAVAFVNTTHDLNLNMGKLIFGLPLYKYFNTPTYNRLKKAVHNLYTFGQDIVNTTLVMKQELHNKCPGEERMVSLFDHISTSSELTSQMVVNVLIALMAAGTDTSSTAFLWLVYQLSRHPQTQEKLYQELKSILGTEGEISNKTIGRLPFLKACVRESMRLNPAVFVVPRTFDHDLEVLGYNIPAGVDIMSYTHVVGIAENHYGQDAKKYLPERWLRDETGKKEAHHPFTALPFGYGVRMCLGRRIAETEIYALMSQLLLSFRLEYAGESALNQHLIGPLMKPDKPVVVKFTPR